MKYTSKLRVTPRIALVIGVVVIVSLLILLAVYVLTRPSSDDFRAAKNNLTNEATKTQAKLVPALNEYLAAFKKAQLQTSSIQKALEATKQEQKAYKTAESAAQAAVKDLKDSRAANDKEVGTAIAQYVDSSEAYMAYLTSLFEFYDEYQILFSSDENVCIDILRTGESSLSERSEKFKKAVKDCYPAIERLQESSNIVYVEYAATLKNRVEDLEEYSSAVAKGEQDYQRFESESQKLQARLAALASDASSSEYGTLLKDIKALDKKIKDSQSDFEQAGTKYKSTVQELPELYGAVFSESVPKHTELLNNLVDVRKDTLTTVLDDKLLDS